MIFFCVYFKQVQQSVCHRILMLITFAGPARGMSLGMAGVMYE